MSGTLNFFLPNDPGSASRRFFLSAAVWLFVGVFVAVVAAIELLAPDFIPAFDRFTFGRLRPTHINIVIFGFLLSAYFGGFLYVVPRVCNTTLFSERLANFAVWFWNLVVLGIFYALPHGMTQGREYAEAPWIVDVAILVAVAVLIVLVFGTIAKRKERLLYVSVWYIAGGLVWTFFVYAVGNVVWDPASGSWEGMNDQILLWFYGHNVVGLVITPQAVALAYYILPRATRSPLYSHTLSLIGFWSILVMYSHIGTHHLLQAPVPTWLKVIAITGSIGMLIPVMTVLVNLWLTMRGRLANIHSDIGGKFVFAGTVWYLLTCIQGPLQSLPQVQRLTHFNNWVVAHSHMGVLGFSGITALGGIYFILPRITGRPIYSKRLADFQYWLLLIGLTGFFTVLTAAGLIQGNAWLNGEVIYRILPQLQVYMVVRASLGILIFAAAVVGFYNIFMTLYGPTGESS
jgi:cytochrome c oxidase cbb3-type subunit 1